MPIRNVDIKRAKLEQLFAESEKKLLVKTEQLSKEMQRCDSREHDVYNRDEEIKELTSRTVKDEEQAKSLSAQLSRQAEATEESERELSEAKEVLKEFVDMKERAELLAKPFKFNVCFSFSDFERQCELAKELLE